MKWIDTNVIDRSKVPVIKVRGVNEYVLGLPPGPDFILEGTAFSTFAKDFLLHKDKGDLEQAVLAMIDIVLPPDSEIKESFVTKCKNKSMLKGPILDHIMAYVACTDRGFLDCVTSSPAVIISELYIQNLIVDAEYDKSIEDIKKFLDTRNFISKYMLPYSFAMVRDFLSIARCHDEEKVLLNKNPMRYLEFYKIFRLVVEAFEKDAMDLCLMSLNDDYTFIDSTLDRRNLVGVTEPSPNRDFIFKAVDVHKDSWSKLKNYIKIVTILSLINPFLTLAGILSSMFRRKREDIYLDQSTSSTITDLQVNTDEEV